MPFSRRLLPGLLLTPLAAAQANAPRVESNVIFGMHSGLALLMDVYHPAKANGYGVVYVSGSGWHTGEDYNAEPLKQNSQSKLYAQRLAAAGYTVFSITHRAAPRFRYPAAVEDVQRAVRFVKHNAQRFQIRADRIGAVGGSSGAHLVSHARDDGQSRGCGVARSSRAVECKSAVRGGACGSTRPGHDGHRRSHFVPGQAAAAGRMRRRLACTKKRRRSPTSVPTIRRCC